MWRKFIFILLILTSSCFANSAPVLTIEIAATPDEKSWGLMGRRTLGENQGMLFVYHPAEKMNFWMFNTFIDLSIAFIDEQQIVREIYFMKAYPEKMDPEHPVKKLADIDQYFYWGPTMNFYRKHSVISKGEYIWALEVNANWFSKHGVKVGDKMLLDEKRHQITFIGI